MREIKFRCWDNEANVMLSDISDGMMIQMNSGKVGWYDDHGDFEEKNYPLMQFTGPKDKNGNGVYESDVITGKLTGDYKVETRGRVVYDLEHLYYATENEGGITPLFRISDIEIIGNAWENPELL